MSRWRLLEVEVWGHPDELAFVPSGRDGFHLAYGVEDAIPARHDLATLAVRLPAEALARWSLSGVETHLDASWPPWLLWLGLTGAVAILAGAAVFALRGLGASTRE